MNHDVTGASLEDQWKEDRLCSLCLRFFEMIGEGRDAVDCPLWHDFGDPQELIARGVVFEDLALYCRRYSPARGTLGINEMNEARRYKEGPS
jgi:hypothetical protein